MHAITVPAFISASEDSFRAMLLGKGHKIEKLKVVLSGSTPRVTWTKSRKGLDVLLVMPGFPMSARLRRSEADLFTGFWLHELGHVLHTDLAVYETAKKEGGESLMSLVNGLEDVRMEQLLIADQKDTAGATNVLHRLHSYMAEKNERNGWAVNDPKHAAWTIAGTMRSVVNGYPWDPSNILASADERMRKVLAIAETGIRASKRTADILPVARQIFDLLSDDNQDDQGQDDQGQDDQGQDDQGQGQGQDDQDDQGQGRGGHQGGQGRPEIASAEPDAAELFARVLSRSDLEDDENGTVAVAAWKRAPETVELDAIPSAITYSDARDRVKNLGKLRREIGELVHSPARIWNDTRQDQGRLDRRQLARVHAGQRDVFVRRRTQEATEALVVLLVDLSGSMSGSRIYAAQTLAIHLGEAIDRVGGKLGIAGFMSLNFDHEVNDFHTDVSPAEIYWYKEINKPLRGARERLSNMTQHAIGGTPLTGAIASTAKLMTTIPATRRILITLSDGHCNNRSRSVRGAVRLAEAHGVNVIGLSLDSDWQSTGYLYGQRIDSREPEALSQTGLSELRRAMQASGK